MKNKTSIIQMLKQTGLSFAICLICLTVVGVVTSIFAPEEMITPVIQINELEGKYISFMGDSITTYQGWNNNTDYNSTIGSNAVWYDSSKMSDVDNTWWKQTTDDLQLELCVNNAWSGSRVTTTSSSTSASCMSRTANLHNDKKNITPDIIVIYIGINDYRGNVTLGSFNKLSDVYNVNTKTYTGDTTVFAEAYAIMVHKVKNAYPEADIYLCNLPYYYDGVADWNKQIKNIADVFNVNLVDFYNDSSITPDTLSILMIDNLHPNEAGMKTMADCVKKVIEENYN